MNQRPLGLKMKARHTGWVISMNGGVSEGEMEQGQIPPHSLHPCSRHQQRELSRATCTPEGGGAGEQGSAGARL